MKKLEITEEAQKIIDQLYDLTNLSDYLRKLDLSISEEECEEVGAKLDQILQEHDYDEDNMDRNTLNTVELLVFFSYQYKDFDENRYLGVDENGILITMVKIPDSDTHVSLTQYICEMSH